MYNNLEDLFVSEKYCNSPFTFSFVINFVSQTILLLITVCLPLIFLT